MTLTMMMQVFKRRWWVILLPVFIALMIIAPDLLRPQTTTGGFTTSFRYTGAQELNLPQRNGDYQDIWLASEYLVNALTDWIRSSTFRQELQQDLGAQFDLSGLGIATDNARSIGLVQMSYPDQKALQSIVDDAIIVLSTRNQVYFPHLEGTSAHIQIIDAPLVVPAPPALSNRFAPFIRIGLALLFGLLIAFIWEYIDPTIRYDQDIQQLGVIIMGRIPR